MPVPYCGGRESNEGKGVYLRFVPYAGGGDELGTPSSRSVPEHLPPVLKPEMGAVSTNGSWQSSVIEYEEVCNECREAIAAQIAAAVKSRLELAEQRQKRNEQ